MPQGFPNFRSIPGEDRLTIYRIHQKEGHPSKTDASESQEPKAGLKSFITSIKTAMVHIGPKQ